MAHTYGSTVGLPEHVKAFAAKYRLRAHQIEYCLRKLGVATLTKMDDAQLLDAVRRYESTTVIEGRDERFIGKAAGVRSTAGPMSGQSADQVKAATLRAEIDRLMTTASGMPVASSLAAGYRDRITELHGELRKLATIENATELRDEISSLEKLASAAPPVEAAPYVQAIRELKGELTELLRSLGSGGSS